MNLRVKILYTKDGISALGSHKSLSADPEAGGGATTVDRVVRIAGGYLVGFRRKYYVVPDAQVDCAEVELVDGPADTPAPRPPVADTPPPAVQAKQVAPPAIPAVPRAQAQPGDIVQDERGVYSRVPFPKAPAQEPAKDEERVVHEVRRGAGRRRMGPSPAAETAPELAPGGE